MNTYRYVRKKELDEGELIAYKGNRLPGKLLCNSKDRFPDRVDIDDDTFEMNAWVYRNARVFGNAYVSGNAHVFGNAWVYGNAQVSGDAWVYGDACVYGDARVSGNARVYKSAMVSGNARVSGDAQVWYRVCTGEYKDGKDVRGSDWDMCYYPMSCKGLDLHIDDRHAVQMSYHLLSCLNASPELMKTEEWQKIYDTVLPTMQRFHRNDVKKLKERVG